MCSSHSSSHCWRCALLLVLCGFFKDKGWWIRKAGRGVFKHRGDSSGRQNGREDSKGACLGTTLSQGGRGRWLLAHACRARQPCPGLLDHTREVGHFPFSSSFPGGGGAALWHACVTRASVPPLPRTWSSFRVSLMLVTQPDCGSVRSHCKP